MKNRSLSLNRNCKHAVGGRRLAKAIEHGRSDATAREETAKQKAK